MRARFLTALGAAVLIFSAQPASSQQIQLSTVVSGLASPIFVGNSGDGLDRLFIVEQAGIIKVLQPGASAPTVFLDIRPKIVAGGEQGLLGLAFHPRYQTNGRFFVFYTRAGDGAIVVAEYHAAPASSNTADPAETVLLTIPHSAAANHNGGMLAFGPDGYLYIGVGDGGGANDVPSNAQNKNVLLGKILRIDIDVPGALYGSPLSNPFFGAIDGRDEIFAYGLRNPWRFSFDRQTGVQWVGDVGQNAREEVDAPIVNGGNYGWRVFEGNACTNNDAPLCANPTSYVFPVFDYGHSDGRCSITGGYVYRGSQGALPAGTYVYGDYCSGEIFAWNGSAQSVLLDTALNISSFGEDERGELYVVSLGGSISKIVTNGPLSPFWVARPTTGAPGTPMSWTVGASGGVGPYQYQFWRLDGNSWRMVRDYDPSPTYTWTPTVADVGDHALQVWVRNAGSVALYDTYLGVLFNVSVPPITITNLAMGARPAPVGQPLMFAASATGGIPPLQYQFWRLDPNGWHVAQDYSPVSTYTWTPGLSDIGTHAVQVWVRSAGSSVAYEAWAGTGIFDVGVIPVAVTALASSVPLPPHVNQAITWSATAIGGVPPLQYQFWRLDADGWHVVQGYSPVSTYTWTPGAGDIGTHAVQVWVRSAGSSQPYEAWAGTGTFAVGVTPVTVTTFNGSVSLPAHANQAITWSATAIGGTAPLEYQFWRLDANQWLLVQDYSPVSTYTWIPGAGDVGMHAVQVWVRSTGSSLAFDAWAGTGLFFIQP